MSLLLVSLTLETLLKELLAFTDILFLAPMDHSSDMVKIFGQSTLNDVCNQMLGELIPENTAKINNSNVIKVTDTINAVDSKSMCPRGDLFELGSYNE